MSLSPFDFSHLPEELSPHIVMAALNEPITIASGPLRIACGSSAAVLDGDLRFRWTPSTALEFHGSAAFPPTSTAALVAGGPIDFARDDWRLVGTTPGSFDVEALLTSVSHGPISSVVTGIAAKGFDVGHGPFDEVRFCLVGLPKYLGTAVRFSSLSGQDGAWAGRLEFTANAGTCVVDKIRQIDHLAKQTRRDGGFLITHVGQWTPARGPLTPEEAQRLLSMLHFWFGLIRAAWAGPIFGQGLRGGNVVWQEFAPWKLDESRRVPTWIPEHSPIEVSGLFQGFLNRWDDPAWHEPLRTAISWLVEANSTGISHESRIILGQVAMEMLSWVHLVETKGLYTNDAFKKLPAAERLRQLLNAVGVPAGLPELHG